MAEHRILGAGTLLLDCITQVDDIWLQKYVDGAKGGSTTVSRQLSDTLLKQLSADGIPVRKIAGGSAANTLAALAAWGVPARLIGMTGNDDDGVFCRQSFAVCGGDISALKVHNTLATGRCISFVTPDSERTMRTFSGASTAMLPSDLSENDMADVDFLLFEGYLLYDEALSAHIMETASRLGIPVGIDLASFELVGKLREKLIPYLKQCRIIFANREEAVALTGQGRDEELLDALCGYAPEAVLKLGRQGALIRMNGSTWQIPAELVENPLDTTGAGDLWQAGFLYGYLRNDPPELCGRFAAATAARLVQVPGARLDAETLDELKQNFTIWEKQQ